jgi:hypothetical protein
MSIQMRSVMRIQTVALIALGGLIGVLAARFAPEDDWFARPVPTSRGNTPSVPAPMTRPLLPPAESTLPIPPVALAGFWDTSTDGQIAHVTDLAANTRLPVATVRFLESVAQTHGLDSVLRNNAAVALLNQIDENRRLEPLFLSMARDETDSAQMREYALQYLARAAERSPDPSRAVGFLMRAAASHEGGIPGTALLHLNRLESQGICRLGEDYDGLVRRILRDESADMLSRMTALNLIGERDMRIDVPYVRELAVGPVVALRRIALAVLGQTGDASDSVILSRAVQDADPTIARSAAVARQNLHAREAAAIQPIPPTEDDQQGSL